MRNKTSITRAPRESANTNSSCLVSTFSVLDILMTFFIQSYLDCRVHSILTLQMKKLTKANYFAQGHTATKN